MTPKPSKEAMEAAALYLATHRADLPMEANVEALAILIDHVLPARESCMEVLAKRLHEALRLETSGRTPGNSFQCRGCYYIAAEGDESHADNCLCRPWAELIGGGE